MTSEFRIVPDGEIKRFIPFAMSFSATETELAGLTALARINGDGSIWVSDWYALQKFHDHLIDTKQWDTFPYTFLLLAARGHVKEVSLEESDRIAESSVHLAPTYP